MKCPNCEETLIMTERQGVEIDYCPKCRGVWLDKGELDKIIEKSQGEMRQQNQDRFDDDDNDDFGRRNPGQRRRGGFLGNLFDFD
ncbi:MAG TPA: zf-TFIIB domain-containing protein [Chitinophagaceae bacterium]|nr:zf-TFIIB domain-containing protein [Chitinophagaceae bacterium]